MKLTKSQKKILKSIPNKKIRLEQKLQFKIQNRFLSREPIIFIDGMFETDNPSIIEFLSQHPMCEKERDDKFKISDEKRAEYNRVLADRREQFEKKIVVEKITDNNLKNTGYEDCFFKVTIPIGTPIQDSLNAVDEFFKQKPVNFPELTSREKALYKIIEMRREFDESANDNPKQFTLEDMRKIYVNGILDNQNLLVTPETCQITFDMHLRNVEKKQ